MGELLRLHGLTKRFGGVAATDDVEWTVIEGEVHALIGPNGAGKTTLVHLISGAFQPDAGEVHFAGENVTRASMHERVRRGLVRSYQVTSIFRRLSALDNARLALQAGRGSSLRLWAPARKDAPLTRDAHALLVRMGLEARAEVAAGTLTHGEQRRLEVALALATRPRLLLLDEPLSALDSETRLDVRCEIHRHLRGFDGYTVLVAHDVVDIMVLADRVVVLDDGRVTQVADPVGLERRPRSAYAAALVGTNLLRAHRRGDVIELAD
ncbi:MAG: ATP-binding cassette domain-containing protein, partial [Burkholderiales bacterium]|nr:ATP-binding cassette domain-containing protein [Burkholderiales bacterium]